jgi:hypothetical protein
MLLNIDSLSRHVSLAIADLLLSHDCIAMNE